MTRVYYKEAVGALVVFDVSRLSTFEGVSKWKADLDEKLRLPDGTKIPAVLLANKIDLQQDVNSNSSSSNSNNNSSTNASATATGNNGNSMVRNQHGEMDKFCEEKEFVGWFGTSAKEDRNIEDACRFLISKILENDQRLADKNISMTGGGRSAGRRPAAGNNSGTGRLVDLNESATVGGNKSSSSTASPCCV